MSIISFQADQGNATGRRKGAFHIWTADSFGSRLNEKETTNACRMCRHRKVKCVVDQAQPQSPSSTPPPATPSCRQCKNLNLECRWDEIDGRKRKRARTSGGAKSASTESRQRATANVLPAQTVPEDLAEPKRSTQSSLKEVHTITSDSTCAPSITITPRAVSLNCDSPFDPEDLQFAQQFLEGFDQCEDASILPDWTDVDNLVLGLDIFEGSPRYSQDRSECSKQASPLRHKTGTIRLRYYRRLGPTAVVPGIRRLMAVVTPGRDNASVSDDDPPISEHDPDVGAISKTPSPMSGMHDPFATTSRGPHPRILSHILDVFFENFGEHFPFLHPEILAGHVQAGEASGFLLNSIAGLTLRFCPDDGELAGIGDEANPKWRRGTTYLEKAKEQLVSLMNVPAPDLVSGLLILAWAELGNNNETGLWILSGMAIRMAQDLGYHRNSELNPDKGTNFHDLSRPGPGGKIVLTDEQAVIHQQKCRLAAFWTTFNLDVYVSLITGRTPTLRPDEIEVDLPTPHDMKLTQLDYDQAITPKNMIFPETVAMMMRFSYALEALNRPTRTRIWDDMDPLGNQGSQNNASRIKTCLSRIVQNYKALPHELAFSITSYKAAAECNHAGLFLTLHIFYYTFVLLLSSGRNISSGPPQSMNLSIDEQEVSERSREDEEQSRTNMIACQKMVQTLVVADLVDKKGHIASPFTNHCFYVAASSILQNIQSQSHSARSLSCDLLDSTATSDYEFLKSKLEEQAAYYGAIGSVVAALNRQEKSQIRIRDKVEGSTDDEDDTCPIRVDGFGDPGMIHRYTIPRDVA